MWKMALILILTALAMFFMRRALEAPVVGIGLGATMKVFSGAPAPVAPPLMYAGIRG